MKPISGKPEIGEKRVNVICWSAFPIPQERKPLKQRMECLDVILERLGDAAYRSAEA
jgi:hypothetical protein